MKQKQRVNLVLLLTTHRAISFGLCSRSSRIEWLLWKLSSILLAQLMYLARISKGSKPREERLLVLEVLLLLLHNVNRAKNVMTVAQWVWL